MRPSKRGPLDKIQAVGGDERTALRLRRGIVTELDSNRRERRREPVDLAVRRGSQLVERFGLLRLGLVERSLHVGQERLHVAVRGTSLYLCMLGVAELDLDAGALRLGNELVERGPSPLDQHLALEQDARAAPPRRASARRGGW